jgi:hypothetical protein
MEVNVQQVNINKQIEFIYTFFKPQIREKDCICNEKYFTWKRSFINWQWKNLFYPDQPS